MRPSFVGWELGLAALSGVGAGFVMPANFYGEGAAEIVTVLGFLIAAFVPAMALSATAIRAGGFSVMRIRALGAAVDRQIKVFGGLFLYALAACALTILGKLLRWGLPVLPIKAGTYSMSLDLSPAFPIVLTALFVFLGLRAMTFIGGILSILNLQTSIAEDEARARDRERDQAAVDELDAYQLPASYGTRIDVTH